MGDGRFYQNKQSLHMTKTLQNYLALVAISALGLVSLLAMPVITEAASVEKVDVFVCPVITSDAVGDHNPEASPLGGTGDYTVVPSTANNGNLSVPITATNRDGYGTPGGEHASPGDTDYTAIWARQ